uniref:Uncharacterized protein n=1 Tax=Anguilla anguilla TaxID=7936 RepID=A0A0E9QFB9_ANGAN
MIFLQNHQKRKEDHMTSSYSS